MSAVFAWLEVNHPYCFPKTKDFPCSGPTYFFLFLSAALELFFILPSLRDTGVGEVTHTPCSQPPPTSQLGFFQVPSGFLLVGIQLLCCYSLLTGIHLVIMSGGLTPLSPPSELPEIPVATREQSGLLCFHSR